MHRPKRTDASPAGADKSDAFGSSAVLRPEDIRVIEDVLKTYCVEVGIVERVEVTDIAAIIVTLWEMGHRTQAQLLARLRADPERDQPAVPGLTVNER